jgi:hypothetical protein
MGMVDGEIEGGDVGGAWLWVSVLASREVRLGGHATGASMRRPSFRVGGMACKPFSSSDPLLFSGVNSAPLRLHVGGHDSDHGWHAWRASRRRPES